MGNARVRPGEREHQIHRYRHGHAERQRLDAREKLREEHDQEQDREQPHEPGGVDAVGREIIAVDIEQQLGNGRRDQHERKGREDHAQHAAEALALPTDVAAETDHGQEVDAAHSAELEKALARVFSIAQLCREHSRKGRGVIGPLGNKKDYVNQKQGDQGSRRGHEREKMTSLLVCARSFRRAVPDGGAQNGGGVQPKEVHRDGQREDQARDLDGRILAPETEERVDDRAEAAVIGEQSQHRGGGDHGQQQPKKDLQQKLARALLLTRSESREDPPERGEGENEERADEVGADQRAQSLFQTVSRPGIEKIGVSRQRVEEA